MLCPRLVNIPAGQLVHILALTVIHQTRLDCSAGCYSVFQLGEPGRLRLHVSQLPGEFPEVAVWPETPPRHETRRLQELQPDAPHVAAPACVRIAAR